MTTSRKPAYLTGGIPITITGIGPLALTGHMTSSQGARVGTPGPNGSTIYTSRITQTFTDVTLNGVSVKDMGVLEVMILPSGYGYVMTRIDPIDGTSIDLPAYQSFITYVNYGEITIT